MHNQPSNINTCAPTHTHKCLQTQNPFVASSHQCTHTHTPVHSACVCVCVHISRACVREIHLIFLRTFTMKVWVWVRVSMFASSGHLTVCVCVCFLMFSCFVLSCVQSAGSHRSWRERAAYPGWSCLLHSVEMEI